MSLPQVSPTNYSIEFPHYNDFPIIRRHYVHSDVHIRLSLPRTHRSGFVFIPFVKLFIRLLRLRTFVNNVSGLYIQSLIRCRQTTANLTISSFGIDVCIFNVLEPCSCQTETIHYKH